MTNPDLGEDPQAYVDSLTYTDDDPPALPPTATELEQSMVATSLKWSPEMRRRVRDVSAAYGITPSMLIRQYIEQGLAAEQPDRMISLSDAFRALSNLRPTG
ncbi:helix-turn-helix domain-containing protein [Skermania piniformis]|uniref:Helix-turn-helix domain containing protein n=1 Tax=Skermania pinensis TaxID=39122 RepID=A0ABX8S3S4_9ACTN|nr:helix-turn-helix domain-containing protein [Skermania piniformis]QXQ12472.1 helix-turn-helix domain containing protein [Skermania piniformis]